MTHMDINELIKYLPHRYPFLLVDRIIDIQLGSSLTALKNVTMNEPFFTGHFPQQPIMPGVLIVEALAQASGVLVLATEGKTAETSSLYYLAKIDKAKFREVVSPGDQLMLHIELIKSRSGTWKFATHATVGDSVVCEVNLTNCRKDT